jgi:acyl-CoA thioesterase-1
METPPMSVQPRSLRNGLVIVAAAWAVLFGMKAAPNLGQDYQDAFDAIYPDLAAKYSLPLYPFFLDGVVGHPDLQLKDGMHPNAKGVDRIVSGALPVVEKSLGKPDKNS